MSGQTDDADQLEVIAANLASAGQRNTADELRVIAKRVRKMRRSLDEIYADALQRFGAADDLDTGWGHA